MNINPRLLTLARGSRAALLVAILAGGLGGLLTIGQAHTLSQIVARVFLGQQSLPGVSSLLRGLILIMVGRSLLVWAGEVSAKTVAIQVKNRLRGQLFAHILKLGPAYTRRERTGELTTAAMQGIEALDAYFSQYLPQLVLSTIIPISILTFVFPLDPLSGLILFASAPLIPVFMILIGKAAETLTNRQYLTLSRLNAHFLDSLQGLTTLKQFGRSKDHTASIAQASEQFRTTTMQVLRVTFLSALVLELAATLSTAVIAVEVGLRLLYARMTFEQAFFLLILAPEFYLPLRMLGLRFHAGMSGTSAARKIFEIFDLPLNETPFSEPGNPEPPPFMEPDPGTTRRLPQIKLEGVSFTYPDETEPALDNIDLTIQPGQHIALVGPSGSGKSTLVQLLLGFIAPTAGQILVDGRPLEQIPIEHWRKWITWAPQKPFLFNTSIAANIRLGQPHASLEAVRQAAKAAHLDALVEALPDGYETIVGERGARLSGGEAQRLALARAFLKDAPILIFDEPTAHLDPITESRLVDSIQVFTGQGGGRRRTMITIAHRLNTITRADQVVVLKNGKIITIGSPAELVASGRLPAGLWDAPVEDSHGQGPALPIQFPVERAPVTGEPGALPTRPTPKLVLRLLGFLHGSWGRVALSAIASTGTILSSLGLMGTSAWLISAAALHPSVAELQVAIVGVRFFGIARGVLRYLERLISHDITFRLLSRLRTWFYQAIEPLAPARLMSYRSGDLLSRVGADVDALENFYLRGVSPIIAAALVSLGAAAYLGRYDVRLGLALLFFLFSVGVLVPLIILLISKEPGRRLVECRTRLQIQLVDNIQGMADLLVFGHTAQDQEQISRAGQDHRFEQIRLARINGFHSALSLFLSNLGMWVVLVYAIEAVDAGRIPGVMLGALALVALVSFEAVQPLPLAAQILGETYQSARRLFELVDIQPGFDETGGKKFDPDLPLAIEFSNLSFTYPGAHKPSLRNINLKIAEGRSVALVGASGAGKSTIVNLLFRFWTCRTGELLIGGQPLERFSPDDLRAQIAVAPQQPYFFNSSLRENLRLGRPKASQAEIEQAAQLAQIHAFITGLPGGYDTFIGEQGVRLSGGERQRLAVARALLKDAPILILDEPTANLDEATGREMLESIHTWKEAKTRQGKRRTILLITHRLVGLEKMDEIVVMDGGQIVERGSQAGLLRANGVFARLYRLQHRSVAP